MFENLKKQIRNPYVFSILTRIMMVLAAFLFTVIQSRFLGPELKGQVAVVNSYTGITSILFEFGIHQAYPYFKKNTDRDIQPVFLRIALLQLLINAAVSVLAILLLHQSLPAKYVAVLIINPFMVYNRVIAYISLVEMPNRKNLIESLTYVAELLLVIVLWCCAPASFAIGVAVIAFKDVVMSVVYTIQWRNKLFVAGDSVKDWVLKVLKFSFFPMLSVLMTTLNYRVDVIMLEGKVTDAAIGVYSIGVSLAERVWLIPDAMKGVLVSNVAKGKGPEEVASVIRICNTVCLCLILGLVALGEIFITLVFGAEYAGAYQVTLILLIGAVFMVYYKMIAAYNIVLGKQRISFLFLFISVVGNVLANWILIPKMGIYGAGFASVISYSICSLLFIVYFIRMTKIPLSQMLILSALDFKKIKAKLKKSPHKKD
ncbi:MAG: polysaccharide biosynthesis C-terminal domain-containing protein [Oscillospiraceae bacterium]|nr:polysaccharide biosynthesis C-terminal domain-containing protein [Oscillospiraceae bacterium]